MIGLGGSVACRGMLTKPIAPVAMGSPSSVVTSTTEVTERFPWRRIVLAAVTDRGAAIGRIRTVMSVVSVHTLSSPSLVIPATASMT